MSQHHKRMHPAARARRNKVILDASNTCHICGHPGADEVDHVIPISSATDATQARRLDTDPTNLKPAHGNKPCQTCGHKCNREKSNKPHAPIVRHSGSLTRP